MFNVFKFHIDSLELYWRVWEKISIKEVTQEIEKFYGAKLDFIEGIKYWTITNQPRIQS